jgi:steroid delta-isomerase-like uncharacterized protein
MRPRLRGDDSVMDFAHWKIIMTPTEEANLRVAYEHFAAESAHDTERTLRTLADDIMYRVVASGATVYGKEAVAKYYDVWWTAFPDVNIEIKRIVATGEWVFAENFVTATHLGPWLGIPPTGKRVIQHLCAVIRCRDGLMTEETVYYDQLERLRQVGSVFTLDGRTLDVPPWQPPQPSS